MNTAYKLFAAAIVLIAIIFGSMEVSYRAAGDSAPETGAAPKAASQSADAPKPVIVPAPTTPAVQPQMINPDPAVAAVPMADSASDDPVAPPPPPTVSVEGQEPVPMVIIPAEGQ